MGWEGYASLMRTAFINSEDLDQKNPLTTSRLSLTHALSLVNLCYRTDFVSWIQKPRLTSVTVQVHTNLISPFWALNTLLLIEQETQRERERERDRTEWARDRKWSRLPFLNPGGLTYTGCSWCAVRRSEILWEMRVQSQITPVPDPLPCMLL